MVLSVADRLATDGPRTTPPQIQRHLAVARQIAEWYVTLTERGPVVPLINGAELGGLLGRRPGRWMTDVLEALREEQVVGLVRTRAQAEHFAFAWAEAHPAA
jgi:hypothetical protein